MFDKKQFELSNYETKFQKTKKSGRSQNRQTGKFIRGPIPLPWIISAINLPPCAIKIGLVLWYLTGLRKSSTVTLSTKMLKEFKIDRSTKYRGLKQLELAGLVEVNRRLKKNPIVTIKEFSITPVKQS
jgi:hypothetical protein